MKGFKPHNMYDKKKVNTHEEHVKLKEKGYNHTPLKKEMEDLASPLSKTPCWDTHTNIVNGKQTFKKKGNKMVPDCKPK